MRRIWREIHEWHLAANPALQPQSADFNIGFNYLMITTNMMEEHFVFHEADSRGRADHGWLKSRHTFSFAQYYNPERMHFGVLRVLNDDHILGGTGFGTHPHDNMEIVSIPLEGALKHKDSMGNTAIIAEGDIQVMSAGTGIQHSEFNNDQNADCRFLQIWIFPNKKNVQPRYDQLTLKKEERLNQLQQILSPNPDDAGVWIHQDAWFHLTNLDSSKVLNYNLKKAGNGVYFFVLSGEVVVNGKVLKSRDGLGAWNQDQFVVESSHDAELLVMEVPLTI
jgi:redox-sensitive bicupin YhaK (pirin superfamily)